MKHIIYCILFCVFGVCISRSGFAQIKYADLEIVINQPSDSTSFPWGDTAKFSFFIQNLGPDSLSPSDTVSVGFLHFGQFFPLTGVSLNSGDSTHFNNAASLWNDDPLTNDTGHFCMSVRIVSSGIVDTNALNDTACVSYVLLGNPTTGIATTEKNKPLKLFPNPASSTVTIQLNDVARFHQLQLTVTDILGREVLSKDYKPKSQTDDNTIRFDVTGFLPGIYFVRLMADRQVFRAKLVVR
ncbi:MAG TPA: T9SS type A sorting domain-containing protein [Edaphocola sp.]|nr:T9SS type A sorting domain-containing protein [Edaphocola sp.]